MLPPDVISAIRVFMERVQLAGKEVPAYTKIMMCLAAEDNDYRLAVEAANKAAALASRDRGKKNGAVKTTEESSPSSDTPALDPPEGASPTTE